MKSQSIYMRSPPAIQTLLLNAKAAELHMERYGNKFNRLWKNWTPNEYLSTDEMRAKQDKIVRRLVQHAYDTVPFYRKRWDIHGTHPEDVKGVEDLFLLPLLEKEEIKADPQQFVSQEKGFFPLRKGNTSGTTGSPLNVFYDIHTCVAHHVVDWRQKAWGGMQRGEQYASLQGRMIVPIEQKSPPYWRKNYLHKQTFLSAFHLKPSYLPSYIDFLRSSKIMYLEGYPSTISVLADWLNYERKKLPLTAVFTSSETLHDFQRSAIEDAFCCKVFDSLGMAERVLFASECEAHEGRHLNEDYGITEILDDNGTPVTDGQPGRLVATGLSNFAFPLIRYKTNDISSRLTANCSCGRTFARIASVTTKEEAIITLSDGRLVSPSVLTHPFKPMRHIAASQIFQDDLYSVRVKIVRRGGYGESDEKLLHAGLEERLGKNVRITFEYVQSVAPTDGKKFRWVVSKVKPSIIAELF